MAKWPCYPAGTLKCAIFSNFLFVFEHGYHSDYIPYTLQSFGYAILNLHVLKEWCLRFVLMVIRDIFEMAIKI